MVNGEWWCMMVYGGEVAYERWKVVCGVWWCMIVYGIEVVYER